MQLKNTFYSLLLIFGFILSPSQPACALRPIASLESRISSSPDLFSLPERIGQEAELSSEIIRLFGNTAQFVAALRDPDTFVTSKNNESGYLSQVSNLMCRVLQSEVICGSIPICDHAASRALCERLFELSSTGSETLEARLAVRQLYQAKRADNLDQIATEFGVDPSLVHYLNIRHSGMTIIGDDAKLLFTRNGKYQKVEGFLAGSLFFSTRKVFLGESPYAYSPKTRKIYYYGVPLDFTYKPHSFQDESENWYFKEVWGPNGPTGAIDVGTLVINFRNFCTKPCPFCWRTYGEQTQATGWEKMAQRNLSVDQGLAQIEAAHGPEVFGQIQKISVMEAGFPSEDEEVAFLIELIQKLKARGFTGKITPFTSFLRSDKSFEQLIEAGFCMDQCLFPLECFTRRMEVLGERKRCELDVALGRMTSAQKYYTDVKAFLLIGLGDNLDDLERYLPEIRSRGLGIQLSMYSIVVPRQRALFCSDIVADEGNNGHIRFLLKAARIAFAYGVTCPDGSVVNGIWPPSANAFVHADSTIRPAGEASAYALTSSTSEPAEAEQAI